MGSVSKHTSRREIFKDYSILTVACLYILDIVITLNNIHNLWNKMHKFTNMIHEEDWIYMFISAIQFFLGKVS
jgi:hypothetical protein